MDSGKGARPNGSVGTAQSVVRRILVFVILFALVTITANGLSGLVERVIGAGSVIAADDSGLALSLAFVFIGGPLAGVLWWWERRRLVGNPSERASLVWALYLTAMSLTSLIVATTALASAASSAIDGEWRPSDVSAGAVWLGVWVWHRHMRRSAVTAPTRLVDVPTGLGSFFGLAVAAAGAIIALSLLISQALPESSSVIVGSQDWVVPILQALAWCALGALVWWWHWFVEGAKHATGAFAVVLLVIVVGLAAATTLFAVGSVLFVVLQLLSASDPVAEVVSGLDAAISAALVGAIIWLSHARVLASRSGRAQRAGRLVVSAIALVGAASGFGIVINALLATLGVTLVDEDPRRLLLVGISALVVGAPAWVIAWRPAKAVTDEEARDPARRVYLVVVFGASAIVAIITLLTIGFRLFEFFLDAEGSIGLVELIRAPLGLLSATVLVFGYHFAIWRRDRAVAAPAAPQPSIGTVILLGAGDVTALSASIRTETGASVSVWPVAQGAPGVVEADGPAVRALLSAISAPRVLVIARDDGGVRAIPLAD